MTLDSGSSALYADRSKWRRSNDGNEAKRPSARMFKTSVVRRRSSFKPHRASQIASEISSESTSSYKHSSSRMYGHRAPREANKAALAKEVQFEQ